MSPSFIFLLLIILVPTIRLSFGRAISHFFFLRTFRHSSISSALITCCRFTVLVTYPSLSAPASPPSSAKSSSPHRRTSTYSPRHLPRRLLRLSADNFAALLLPRLRAPIDPTCGMALFRGRLPLIVSIRSAGTTGPPKSVDPTASPATSFVSSSESDGASCVFSLGSNGASCISSSGSDGASRVSSSGSGTSPVSPRQGPAAPSVSLLRGLAAPPAFLLCWLLLQLQLLYVELRGPSFSNRFIFTSLYVEVLITNTVAVSFVRPVDLLHGLPFCFHLQARLSERPLARRHDFHCLGVFLRYLLTRVREHAMYLHDIARFCRHRQRCPLTRAPSHICAGPPLARRCSHRLRSFRCQRQRQRRSLTRASSYICAGPPLTRRLYLIVSAVFAANNSATP